MMYNIRVRIVFMDKEDDKELFYGEPPEIKFEFDVFENNKRKLLKK